MGSLWPSPCSGYIFYSRTYLQNGASMYFVVAYIFVIIKEAKQFYNFQYFSRRCFILLQHYLALRVIPTSDKPLKLCHKQYCYGHFIFQGVLNILSLQRFTKVSVSSSAHGFPFSWFAIVNFFQWRRLMSDERTHHPKIGTLLSTSSWVFLRLIEVPLFHGQKWVCCRLPGPARFRNALWDR